MSQSDKTVTVVLSPNPLAPNEGRMTEVLTLREPRKIRDVVGEGTDLDNIVVRLDGELLENPANVYLRGGEVLTLVPKLQDPVSFGAAIGTAIGVSAATGTVIANILIATALNLLISTIAAAGRDDSLSSKRKDAAPIYEIANGQNTIRAYGAIPMVIGRRRIFPDISARPFTEMVPDIFGESPAYEVRFGLEPNLQIVFDNSWTSYGNTGLFIQPDPFPAGSFSRRVNGSPGSWQDYVLYDPTTDSYMTVLDWSANDGVFVGVNPAPGTGQQLDWTYYDTTGTLENSQRLTQIFCAGWGDVEFSEPRIVDTLLEERAGPLNPDTVPANYRGVQVVYSELLSTDSRLSRYPSDFSTITGQSDLPPTKYRLTGDGRFPESVWSEPGGTLERKIDRNNGNAELSEFEGWIERVSPADTIHIQIDVTGRLHALIGGDVFPHAVDVECQYADVDPNTGASLDNWTTAPGSPFTITNGDLTMVRETLTFDLPTRAATDGRYYAVRARKVTPDEADPDDGGNPNLVAELELSEVRFQRDWLSDTRSPDTGRTFESRGQNRIGLVVTASSQLNGNVDRFNLIAQGHCWIYTGGAVWDGTYPGAGGNWRWAANSNPAWWLLAMARGGFYNSVTPFPGRNGGPVQPNRGWFPGVHPDNEERIFGAGYPDERIDFASIIRFGSFCAYASLYADAYLQDVVNAHELLSKIAALGRGSVSFFSGRLGVVYEDPREEVSAVYNVGNIVAGSFSMSYASEQLPDEYRGTYTHGEQGFVTKGVQTSGIWEEKHVSAKRPGVTRSTNTGQVDLFGIITTQQAQREVNLLAIRTVEQRRALSWSTSDDGHYSIRGEVVALAHNVARWAISARVYELEIAGGFVRAVTLPKREEWNGSGPLYAWVRLPDLTFVKGQVVPWQGDADRIVIQGDWWAAVDAPCHVGVNGQANESSAWARDLTPSDWLIQIGAQETPGRKVRIISHTPQSDGTIKMEGVDESPQVWAHEFDNVAGAPIAPYVTPASGETVPVRACEVSVTRNALGTLYLEFELYGTNTASVTVSVNGGAAGSFGPTSDRKIQLPDYGPGTRLAVGVVPVADAEEDYGVVYESASCVYVVPPHPTNEATPC